MYRFIEDKDFLKRMKADCSDTVNRLVQFINNGDYLEVGAELIGSGARNLITQNESEPVDLDYNLVIYECAGDINDGSKIKNYVKDCLDEILQQKGDGNCQDSTSCLSTDKFHFKKGNKTEFSIDLAIVQERNDGWYRLIHRKTGFTALDQWYWNKVPNSACVFERAEAIKNIGKWTEVRAEYLKLKNRYLQSNGYSHPSFVCYIEAVNMVYQSNRNALF